MPPLIEPENPATRHQIAASLRQLANQWERGQIDFDEIHVAVPDLARLAVKHSADQTIATLTIEIHWPNEAVRRLA